MQKNLQLVYIYEGEARIKLNGKEHLLGEGEAALLVPGRMEHFLFSKKGRTRHGWCEVRSARLDRTVRCAYERLPFSGPLTPRMATLAAMALSLAPHSRVSEQRLYDALAQAMLLDYLSALGFGDDPAPPLPEPLRRAVEQIDSHYAGECGIGTLARVAGVTGAHLIRLFRKHMGMTPMQSVWKRRAEEGAQMLRETGLSVAEIAYQCGFQTPFHFSRTVRKHVGQSPRAYRRKMWGK